MSVRRSLLTLALAALLGAGPVVASPALAAAPPSHGSRTLAALLTGRQEVPGPGDTDGWGAANVRVWPWNGRVCYSLFVQRVDGTVNGAHIHVGMVGQAGAVVVPLDPPTIGWSRGCTTIATAVAWQLARWPGHYYVNVHSTVFPNGAIRGQLFGQRWRSR
jgi:hypothetical protein